MPTSRPALVILCAALLGGACSTAEQPGVATSASNAASAAERAAALAALQPCGVLTPTEAQRMGYTARTPLALAGTRACLWNADDQTDNLSVTFGTGRIAELTPSTDDTTTTHTIGEHRGVRLQAADEPRCTVVFDVGTRDLVSVQAVTSTTVDAACRRVMEVATMIEPALP